MAGTGLPLVAKLEEEPTMVPQLFIPAWPENEGLAERKKAEGRMMKECGFPPLLVI
jgi:hypothetical protein